MSETRPWLVIINPHAGYPRSFQWRDKIASRLARRLDCPVVFTERAGHATELARAAREFDGIAVWGGDGTIAQVVNGMDLARQKLLVLGGGTGNGLARDLGLTFLGKVLAMFRANAPRRIDLIHVAFAIGSNQYSRFLVSTAALGFVADVVHLSQRFSRRWGEFRYWLASVQQANRLRSFSATISVAGAKPLERPLSNALVNNSRYAGNFKFFPRAKISDGQMDVALASADPKPTPFRDLALISLALPNNHSHAFQARALTIRPRLPQRLMLDGELWEDVTQVSFAVLPDMLQCAIWY